MPQLINQARADAMFDTVQMYDTSQVTVEIPSIQITKVADMEIWHGDVLTYTITVENLDEAITATEASFTDTINPALAVLDVESVYVNGTQLIIDDDFTYNVNTGELVIDPIPDIDPESSYVITFQVRKA